MLGARSSGFLESSAKRCSRSAKRKPGLATRDAVQFFFILNPTAGGSLARRRRARLMDALASSKIDYDVGFTERRRHAYDLARLAAKKGFAVVAVGGDGTAHEAASGIIDSGADVPLAVIPMGTGNDFVKMLDMPDDDLHLLRMIAEGHFYRVDYGRISWTGPEESGLGYFINIGGFGFDAETAAAASRFKWLAGTARYAAAVLRTLVGWSAPLVDLSLVRDGQTVYRFDGSLFLALAGNGKCSGGGFYLTPAARIDDGMLDVCVIRDLSIARVLTLMPRALNGRHVYAEEVRMERASCVRMTSSTPLAVQADGEILTENATRIEIDVIPAGLRLLIPVKR